MKKFKSLLLIMIMVMAIAIVAPESKAATLTISFSKSSANVGDTVNVTVNGSGIAGKILLSVSGNATLSQSNLWVDNSSATATLKINGTGNIKVTATPVDASDSTTATSGTIKVAETSSGSGETSTPTKSNVATLSNLGIKPNDFSGFSAGKTSYSVEVPNETETIEVYASKGQSGQTISGTGKKTLKEGANTFSVVVTAEDGKTKKTYTINVTRKQKTKPQKQKKKKQMKKQQQKTKQKKALD